MLLFVNEDQKKVANDVDMVDYLLAIGEPLKQEGSYYRHIDHDSLVINTKQNYFTWNSKGVSGNAITYLMHVKGLSFQESVLKINDDLGQKEIKTFDHQGCKNYLDEFVYNVNEVSNTDAIESYLIGERGIDKDIVMDLIKTDYIKQDSYKNIVFKWKKANMTIGASLQGTTLIPEEKRISPDRAYFKKILKNTEENTYEGFSVQIGQPKKIYFFESPIDLLSYMSLYKKNIKNCLLKSMDGLKHEVVFRTISSTSDVLRQQKKDIEQIKLCVDNDQAGKEFANKLSCYAYKRIDKHKVKFTSHVPQRPKREEKWDWNNELKKKKIDRRMDHEGSLCL